MKTQNDLKQLLHSIHRKSYPAYKDTRGSYAFDHYLLRIDHVQGDPFAAPSKVSLYISGKSAAFPEAFYARKHLRIALQDHLTRLFGREIARCSFKANGSGKSGLLAVSRPGQEILERSACEINPADGSLILRMEVGFPATGRTIQAMELIRIFFDFLPPCVEHSLFYKNLDQKKLQKVIELAEDQQYIREELDKRHLVAFVANGSILPRESGISSLSMKQAVPFRSPASMLVELHLPHHGKLAGMGIREGITLIVGGGYHGKSTLLKALELGVYNHIAGDGREYCITRADAMKIRAEDGRSIQNTDISLFINNLPNKKDTRRFSTEDASGSTSQAANVIEALEAGTSLFLIDEDTCATNFMIRDELMQRVVHRDQEPITPFIERVRPLFTCAGVSSVLVAGSCGSYFQIADCILQMDRYVPKEITAFAKEEASQFPPLEISENTISLPAFQRVVLSSRDFAPGARIKQKTLGKDAFSINRDTVDLRYVEQLIDSEQTTALSCLLKYAQQHLCDGRHTLQEIVEELVHRVETEGWSILSDNPRSNYAGASLAMPRKQEIYACFNRYRNLKLKP